MKNLCKMPRRSARNKTKNSRNRQAAPSKVEVGAQSPEQPPIHAQVDVSNSFDTEEAGSVEVLTQPKQDAQSPEPGCQGDHDVPELARSTMRDSHVSLDAQVQPSMRASLPHLDDLMVRTADGYRLVTHGELLRVSDDKIVLLELTERKVAVPCGCDKRGCAVLVQVGTHGKYAVGASRFCPHCFRGPFAGESVAVHHWKTDTCKKKQRQGT